MNGVLSEKASHDYNMFKICVNDVKILSNKFETDFELDQVMNMEAMLKICFKCVQFRFEHVLNRI